MSVAQDQELLRIIKNRGVLRRDTIRGNTAVPPTAVLRIAKEVRSRRDAPMADVTDEELIAEAQSRDVVVPPSDG